MNYKDAGVDIEEGYRAVNKYREYAASTASRAVINGIGSFAGMFSLKEFFASGGAAAASAASPWMEDPVLVSGTDGVGTKLDIALRMKKYDTVGIDCVAMCANDILCHGARPLFFLDYIACGKLDAAIAADLVKGIAAGCRETGTALLGGETAEHPGMMNEGDYDLAGFAVGIIDRKNIISGRKIQEGDVLLGLASSGVHSNGFSLIRKVIKDLDEDFGGMPLGRVLLEPTRLYVRPILELINQVDIHGMAHITGGGFYENVPRMFCGSAAAEGSPSSSFSAVVRDPLLPGYDGLWKVPPIFERIASGINNSGLDDPETKKLMFNTYNMGIGFVLALSPDDVQKAAAFLEQKGFPAWEIGRVEKSGGSAPELRFV